MNLYALRREKLLKNLPDNAIVVFFSGEELMRSEDEAYPFDVNRNFYYLSGLEKASMILALVKFNGQLSEHLFLLPYDETLARWVGGRMSKEEASSISGIEQIHDVADFDGFMSRYMNFFRMKEDAALYLDLWYYQPKQQPSEAINYAKRLEVTYPGLNIRDIYPFITEMRLIKDEYEITCIKQANHTTRLGVEAMMKAAKPGLNEMSMEGVFDFVLRQNLCNKNAFKTIAASGERATILHYSDNDQPMKDGELFLCDLGASFRNYAADISRTFPVNGHFTDRQKELYEIVLNVQKLVEKTARPGMTLKELNSVVLNYYREELPKHGLMKDVREYYFHSVSHHLGLDTHDVDLYKPLEAGNVITNEPGLYVADEGIGIRIEDDLLITGSGSENLSSEMIKEVEDIEALMA